MMVTYSAELLRIGVVGTLSIEAGGWDFGPGIAALGQQLPKSFSILSITGKLAAQSNDRNRLSSPLALGGVLSAPHCV